MKNLITILFLIPTIMFGQKAMTEKQALEKSHIDFTKEYLFFTIHGLIEIDGHTFRNDTCKCPIIFQATLDGISIKDTCTKIIYEHRKCDIVGCKIVHLQVQNIKTEWHEPYWRNGTQTLEFHPN